MDTTISGLAAKGAAATLDTWAAHDWSDGVILPQLSPHDQLIVRTRNSTYEIIVLEPRTASVMVRGGVFFPTFTPARVTGCSMGGSCLKVHGVYPGFHLELATDDLPIITTRMQTVSVLPARPGSVM